MKEVWGGGLFFGGVGTKFRETEFASSLILQSEMIHLC